MTAAVLGRTTRQAKILLLGNILPIEDNPVADGRAARDGGP